MYRSLFRSRYLHVTFFLSSILSSVSSLPLLRFWAYNPSPSSLLSPSSPLFLLLARAYARACRLFSCFYASLVFSLPKYNWRCDAPVFPSLSALWPSRPFLQARACSLTPRIRLRRILDACRQLANSRLFLRQETLIARYLELNFCSRVKPQIATQLKVSQLPSNL